MFLPLPLSDLFQKNRAAVDIVQFLKAKKVASLYQIAEGIREKPPEFQAALDELVKHGVIALSSGNANKLPWPVSPAPIYLLTPKGYDIAVALAKALHVL